MGIDSLSTLGELVRERPARARVLERLGLDYCCGGRRTLAEACEERGLDANTVAVFLAGDAEPVASETVDWGEATVAELCAHIVDVHHERLRWELPRLGDLASRAAEAHGAELPELAELRDVFESLRLELEEHIVDEERQLFPRLVAGETPSPEELAQLEREHDEAGAALHRLRELTHGYDRDRALCNVHRTLLDGLHGLELDLHQHVHEENNVLFVRARALAV
ncbi:MAG TPA: DUF542 domain-containing protein [Gaiellaceae bacterium]|jgi:regulator of cell morphogenesis and NO signaling